MYMGEHMYIYIYIYTHTHTHTHIYIYIYIYMTERSQEGRNQPTVVSGSLRAHQTT
jgi:hypothetical protein